jgi:hypothetical protein
VLVLQNGMDHALQILVPGDSPVPVFPAQPRYRDMREPQKKMVSSRNEGQES